MLTAAYRCEVEWRRQTFRMTPALGAHIREVAAWLTGNSPTFGLFLCGHMGNGKSTMLRALGTLSKWLLGRQDNFRLVNARDVVRFARAFADTNDSNWRDAESYRNIRDGGVVAIDDVGTESRESMVYGSVVSPVIDLVYDRYDAQLPTLVSTNLDTSDIADRYDARVYDRFREMMTVINFGDEPSFRSAETATE